MAPQEGTANEEEASSIIASLGLKCTSRRLILPQWPGPGKVERGLQAEPQSQGEVVRGRVHPQCKMENRTHNLSCGSPLTGTFSGTQHSEVTGQERSQNRIQTEETHLY